MLAVGEHTLDLGAIKALRKARTPGGSGHGHGASLGVLSLQFPVRDWMVHHSGKSDTCLSFVRPKTSHQLAAFSLRAGVTRSNYCQSSCWMRGLVRQWSHFRHILPPTVWNPIIIACGYSVQKMHLKSQTRTGPAKCCIAAKAFSIEGNWDVWGDDRIDAGSGTFRHQSAGPLSAYHNGEHQYE
jgi:hypothetical protein